MERSMFAEIDLIEELRLRRWARENYVSAELREDAWHPIVHDEMSSKDVDGGRMVGYETSLA